MSAVTTMCGVKDSDVLEALGGLLLELALDYEMSHACLEGHMDESWLDFRDWVRTAASDERVRGH